MKYAETETLIVDDLEVELIRKRIKNLHLHVKSDGRVVTSAPMRMPKREIVQFIRDKRGWIVKTLARVEDSPSAKAEMATPVEKREWLDLISVLTPPLIAKWEQVMGVECKELVFRNMKSRWGSCKPSTGRICINTRLALYPPDCLEYVVVHELCHMKERGHGPAFKALMDRYLPNWRQIRAKLR